MSRFSRLTLAAGLIALSLAALPVIAQEQPTGTLALSTQINGDGTLTPTLRWETTPAATSCVATGDSAWEGTKAGSGVETLEPFPTTTPKSYALLCSWPGGTSALLTWRAPTQFAPFDHDNNPSTPDQPGAPMSACGPSPTAPCLAGYRIHWGTNANALVSSNQLMSPTQTSWTIDGLTDGTWFFGVRALTNQGAESLLSNITSKIIRSTSLQWSQAAGVPVPAAPTLDSVE